MNPQTDTARWIGTDEAGYGPNLGPLVISLTSWEVPTPGPAFDLYTALSTAVDRDSNKNGTRLHIADSKKVYSPGRGLASLERSALALLAQVAPIPRSFNELVIALTGSTLENGGGEPWLRSESTPIPLVAELSEVTALADLLKESCHAAGVRLGRVASDLVETPRFNDVCQTTGSKGVLLSQMTLGLLERNWPNDALSTFVTCDKHGGRNQYAALLCETFSEVFIPTLEESSRCSRYRVRSGEICFQVRAEQYLPTAAASIISKYLREVTMEQFNTYWHRHVPGIKPTKGYPEDARRFRAEIQEKQGELGITDHVLWRSR